MGDKVRDAASTRVDQTRYSKLSSSLPPSHWSQGGTWREDVKVKICVNSGPELQELPQRSEFLHEREG